MGERIRPKKLHTSHPPFDYRLLDVDGPFLVESITAVVSCPGGCDDPPVDLLHLLSSQMLSVGPVFLVVFPDTDLSADKLLELDTPYTLSDEQEEAIRSQLSRGSSAVHIVAHTDLSNELLMAEALDQNATEESFVIHRNRTEERFLLFLSGEVYPSGEILPWLEHLHVAAHSSPSVGVVGCPVITETGGEPLHRQILTAGIRPEGDAMGNVYFANHLVGISVKDLRFQALLGHTSSVGSPLNKSEGQLLFPSPMCFLVSTQLCMEVGCLPAGRSPALSPQFTAVAELLHASSFVRSARRLVAHLLPFLEEVMADEENATVEDKGLIAALRERIRAMDVFAVAKSLLKEGSRGSSAHPSGSMSDCTRSPIASRVRQLLLKFAAEGDLTTLEVPGTEQERTAFRTAAVERLRRHLHPSRTFRAPMNHHLHGDGEVGEQQTMKSQKKHAAKRHWATALISKIDSFLFGGEDEEDSSTGVERARKGAALIAYMPGPPLDQPGPDILFDAPPKDEDFAVQLAWARNQTRFALEWTDAVQLLFFNTRRRFLSICTVPLPFISLHELLIDFFLRVHFKAGRSTVLAPSCVVAQGLDSGSFPVSIVAAEFGPLSSWIPILRQYVSLRYRSRSISVTWTGYCCHCCGFTNEMARMTAALAERIPTRATLGTECHCDGLPSEIRDSIDRMHIDRSALPLLHDGRSAVLADGATFGQPFSEDALQIWVYHVDPIRSIRDFFWSEVRQDYIVSRSMTEFSSIPENWVEVMSSNLYFDEIWAPSHFVRDVFVRAGVPESKVKVIPEPIETTFYDPSLASPLSLPIDLRDRKWRHWNSRSCGIDPGVCVAQQKNFKFLSMFKWEPRKGWDVLLEAFFRAFLPSDTVSLYMHTFLFWSEKTGYTQLADMRDPSHMVRDIHTVATQVLSRLRHPERGMKIVATLRQLPHVVVITRSLSEFEVRDLFASVDAFVLPTRGEGWGLPIIQAMSMGLPTIATRYGGQVDFMTDDTTYMIDVDAVVDVPKEAPYRRGINGTLKWAEPSCNHLVKLLRYVVNHPKEARARGQAARAHVATNYGLSSIGDILASRVMEIAVKYAAHPSNVTRPPIDVRSSLFVDELITEHVEMGPAKDRDGNEVEFPIPRVSTKTNPAKIPVKVHHRHRKAKGS